MLLVGCAMNQVAQRLQTDTHLQAAARQLTADYLEDQKAGGLGTGYGAGASRFYNLAEYKVVAFGWEFTQPAVFVRVKAGSHAGGNPIWENYSIRFVHDPKLEAAGDRYLGLRIGSVGETLVKF